MSAITSDSIKIAGYDDIQPSLLRGHVDACLAFLDERHEQDSGTIGYWYWRMLAFYRGGQFGSALDVAHRLTRDGAGFAAHVHCMADMYAHMGAIEPALQAIDALAAALASDPVQNAYVRLYGYHYLGEDGRVMQIACDQTQQALHMTGQYRARSAMRSLGLDAGVTEFAQHYCSSEAVSTFWPQEDVSDYWFGQRSLPRTLLIRGHACGYGDFINWSRYARVLDALGVQVRLDGSLHGLVADTGPDAYAMVQAQRLVQAGFGRSADDTQQWTTPFALFTALFPVLGYASTASYVRAAQSNEADSVMDDVRMRARGRPCVGLFWSSCESNNLFAHRSVPYLCVQDLLEACPDIHWVIMQRGYDLQRWRESSQAADSGRFTTLPERFVLRDAIALIDRLDYFVGNDGVLTHAAGALGKAGCLVLNRRCTDWRYEQHETSTPWYPHLRVVRPDRMGEWSTAMSRIARIIKETL